MWPNPQETRKSPSGKLYFLYSMNVGPDSSWLAKWVLQWLKLTFSFRNDGKSINSIQPILYQCSISITSENVRELSVFSRFQGLWIWYIGIKWVSFNWNTAQKMKKSLMKNFIFCAVKFVPMNLKLLDDSRTCLQYSSREFRSSNLLGKFSHTSFKYISQILWQAFCRMANPGRCI